MFFKNNKVIKNIENSKRLTKSERFLNKVGEAFFNDDPLAFEALGISVFDADKGEYRTLDAVIHDVYVTYKILECEEGFEV